MLTEYTCAVHVEFRCQFLRDTVAKYYWTIFALFYVREISRFKSEGKLLKYGEKIWNLFFSSIYVSYVSMLWSWRRVLDILHTLNIPGDGRGKGWQILAPNIVHNSFNIRKEYLEFIKKKTKYYLRRMLPKEPILGRIGPNLRRKKAEPSNIE